MLELELTQQIKYPELIELVCSISDLHLSPDSSYKVSQTGAEIRTFHVLKLNLAGTNYSQYEIVLTEHTKQNSVCTSPMELQTRDSALLSNSSSVDGL